MAFSMLRICTRSNLVVFEKNIGQMLKNAAGSAKNARHICGCSSIAATARKLEELQLAARHYSKHTKPKAEKKYDSDSETDSDLDVLGHRGESKFWRRKMRTFHGILDVNKDGVISFDDFKLLTDRFVHLGHMSEKNAKEFQELIKNLWEKQWGEISPYNLVTVEQYLEDMYHVLNDKERVRKAHAFLPYIFKAVDKDKSGDLTLDEFELFFKCLGLEDKDALFTFRSIDTNGDGRISLKEFMKHGRDFFVTEDETNISKYFWGPLVDV